MTTPADLKYSQTHKWVRPQSDGTASIGITFHAQEQLGDIVFVQCPAVGRQLKQGEECGVIESVKAASDIDSPVGGEVIAINTELEDAPQKVNEDPYAAWLYRVKMTNVAELGGLLDATAYAKVAEADKD